MKKRAKANAEGMSFRELASALLAVPKAEVEEQAADYEHKKERKRKAQAPKDREITK